jgi:hypothetical protein
MQTFLSSRGNLLLCGIVTCALALTGCNKNASSVTPSLPGNEFLTTVQLRLVNTADPSDVQTAISTQMSPTTNTYQVDSVFSNLAYMKLKANSMYTCQVIILDETKTPFDTVSDEIYDRRNYHLLFFQPTPVLSSSVDVSDTSTAIPVTDWVTGQSPTDTTAFGWSVNELESTSAATALNLRISRTDLDSNTPPMQIGLQNMVYTGAASTGILRVVMRHQPNAKNGTYAPGSSDFDVTYAVIIQ